jgi:hypothetical protein
VRVLVVTYVLARSCAIALLWSSMCFCLFCLLAHILPTDQNCTHMHHRIHFIFVSCVYCETFENDLFLTIKIRIYTHTHPPQKYLLYSFPANAKLRLLGTVTYTTVTFENVSKFINGTTITIVEETSRVVTSR